MIRQREVTDSDMELILAWRSNPLVYEHFFLQKAPLTWEEHISWWKSQQHRKSFIIQYKMATGRFRDIGVISIHRLDTDMPEIDYYIGEVSLWGKGIGKEIVKLALATIKEMGYKEACARVMDSNERSKRLLLSLGLGRKGISREGESIYIKDL